MGRGLLLALLLLSRPLECGCRCVHRIDGKVRLRDCVTGPGPRSQQVAAPGLVQRYRDGKPTALPDPPPCSLLQAATHLCKGQEPMPDIPGAQWRPQRRKRGVVDAATEEEEEGKEINP